MDNIKKEVKELVKINEEEVKSQLSQLVKDSVEKTLNALLDEEADKLCQASKYERAKSRCNMRAGKYKRKLHTQAGEITLEVPKLRQQVFETAIIERYKRRESSVEEALVEMYLAGVSTRKVEDITEALWGSKVSAGTISNLNKKVFVQIQEWREGKLTDKYVYLYLDGITLKKCFAGEVRHISFLVAMGINSMGFREIVGVMEGLQESYESWREFLRNLKARGIEAVDLIISDAHLGLQQALAEVFSNARWQRCIVHFYRNVLDKINIKQRKEVALMLKAIHGHENRQEAYSKAIKVADKLASLGFNAAAKLVRENVGNTLTYYDFQSEHWRRIRSNNPLERIMREIRRRTRVVGSFPDGDAAINLVSARLRYIVAHKWSDHIYLNMEETHDKIAA